MKITRREAFAALSAVPLLQGQSKVPSTLDRPMRWAQIAFVEDDPTNYDPRFWFDYLKRISTAMPFVSAPAVVWLFTPQDSTAL